jgi:hypothetical protein
LNSAHRKELRFDIVVGICIIANIVFIFARLEYDGQLAAVALGLKDPGSAPDWDNFFDVMQHVFCLIFLVELIVRLAVFRTAYFYEDGALQKFNILDCTIVLFTVIDLWVITPLMDGQDTDLTVIRIVRFARLMRAVRVLRTFEIFSKLRVLFATVAASFYALLWSMILLFLTMLMAALILTQMVNTYLAAPEPTVTEQRIEWMFLHYGTAGRSLWTVFEATMSGGWPNYARPLVEEVSSLFAFFFAAYVSMVIFAMTRIITALFLKDTLEVASNDAEMMINEKTRQKRELAAKLLDLFEMADTSGDGKITWDEFIHFFGDPTIKSYMATLELDMAESQSLFHMLDDGDGQVTAHEFVQGALRLKGTARSQDVVSMMHDFNRQSGLLVETLSKLSRIEAHLRLPGLATEHNSSLGRLL